MAGKDNLMPIEEVNSRRSRGQHSKDSSKGGKASGKARREKKAMKDTLETLLTMSIDVGTADSIDEIQSIAALNGKNISVQEAIMLAQIKKAIEGDTKAAEYIRDTSGNKLKEGLELSGGINNPFEGLTTEQLKKLVEND